MCPCNFFMTSLNIEMPPQKNVNKQTNKNKAKNEAKHTPFIPLALLLLKGGGSSPSDISLSVR